MKLKYCKDGDKYLVENENSEILGEGFIREFEASRLYNKKRINYYIHSESERDEVKFFLVDSFIRMAKIKRLDYPDHDAIIYNCCFSHDIKSIEFYEKIDGFEHDEGMWVLRKFLDQKVSLSSDYKMIHDNLQCDDDIEDFIEKHSKIFVSLPYSLEKIRKLQNKNQLKSFGVYDGDLLLGNVMILKEDNQWWVEDLFVSSDHRKKHLASMLMNVSHNYLIDQGVSQVQLEVWSSNERAMKLYRSLGYEFLNETESSIGMFI